MTERADETIKALRSGHDDLAALVRGFTADDLARPSGASKWDVSQVLSHLGSGAEISLASLGGAGGGPGPRGGDYNQRVGAGGAAMPGGGRGERSPQANEPLPRRYEGLDASTRQNLRIDLGF